jgi:hypothetical protein
MYLEARTALSTDALQWAWHNYFVTTPGHVTPSHEFGS